MLRNRVLRSKRSGRIIYLDPFIIFLRHILPPYKNRSVANEGCAISFVRGTIVPQLTLASQADFNHRRRRTKAKPITVIEVMLIQPAQLNLTQGGSKVSNYVCPQDVSDYRMVVFLNTLVQMARVYLI